MLDATAALVDRDIERADRILAEALDRGVRSAGIESLASVVHRSRHGPAWGERFRAQNHVFLVESDHSYAACRDVLARLTLAMGVYKRWVPGREPAERKARVRVFSGRRDYEAYGEELGTSFSGSAGCYLPHVRELVLFYRPGSSEMCDRVIRHEGFHWYLHEVVEDVPIWFNEGHAMCFESSERPGGPPEPTAPNPGRVLELSFLAKEDLIRNPSELMRMDHRTFMREAERNYAQAWALVHFLRTTDREEFRGKLDAYFDRIREGASRDEAYAEVFAPIARPLDRAYRTHVRMLVGARR
jgi:hypothetical protein